MTDDYVDRARTPKGWRARRHGELCLHDDLYWNGYDWVRLGKLRKHDRCDCKTITRKEQKK